MADIIAPNLFDKNGKQIPRADYLDENGYADSLKMFTTVDHRITATFEAFDEDGKPVDLRRFHEIYCKHSMSEFIIAKENGDFLDPNRILAFKNSTVGKKTIHARKFFEKQVDITDPCYPNDDAHMEYRLAVPITAGDYECVTWEHVEDGDINDGRTMIIGIYLNGAEPNMGTAEIVGTIGVDTGTAGFFMNKPNYTDEEWQRIVRSDFESIDDCYELPWPELMQKVHAAGIHAPDVHVTKEGFYSCIGWGDGDYYVLGYKENGEFIAFEILG